MDKSFIIPINFNGNPIKIPNYSNLINIYLCYDIKSLPNNVNWVEYFLFRYIKNITIKRDDLTYFETNGLIIKTKYDIKSRKKNNDIDNLSHVNTNNIDDLIELSKKDINVTLSVPLKLKIPFESLSFCSDFILYFKTNNNITVPHLPELPINITFKFEYVKSISHKYVVYNNIIDTTKCYKSLNHCEKITINGMDKEYDYPLQLTGFAKWLIFYLEGGISISSISLTFHNITNTFSFIDMNTVLPYLIFNIVLPKNMLIIPFLNHDVDKKIYGLNFSRFDKVNIKFNFKKNKGGTIYLISTIKNIIQVKNLYNQYLLEPSVDNWMYFENNYSNFTFDIVI
jgi:hypothetical protein